MQEIINKTKTMYADGSYDITTYYHDTDTDEYYTETKHEGGSGGGGGDISEYILQGEGTSTDKVMSQDATTTSLNNIRNTYQLKTDTSLTTDDKTIAGAINELASKNTEIKTDDETIKQYGENKKLYCTGEFINNIKTLKAYNFVGVDKDDNTKEVFTYKNNVVAFLQKVILNETNLTLNHPTTLNIASGDLTLNNALTIKYPSSTTEFTNLFTARMLVLNSYLPSNFVVEYVKGVNDYSGTDYEVVNIAKLNSVLATKQDKTDDTLKTDSKEIVGAINENRTLINSLVAQLKIKVVDAKPDIGENRTIYYIGSEPPYDIYLYIDDTWTFLGTSSAELDDYYKKEFINNNCLNIVEIEENPTNFLLKVTFVSGTQTITTITKATYVEEGNTHIVTSGAVWNKLLSSGEFTLDTSSSTKDTIVLKLKDNSSNEVVNSTIDFGDKLTFKTNTQTLTNKSLDCDETKDDKNTITNIPLSSLAKQDTKDKDKSLVIQSDGTIKAGDVRVPMVIARISNGSTLPTTRSDGTDLMNLDEIIVAKGADTPFEIGTYTITTTSDKLIWNTDTNSWDLYSPSLGIVDTIYPVGSIFVQYPEDSAPSIRFKNTTWKNISASYLDRYLRIGSTSGELYEEMLPKPSITIASNGSHTHTVSGSRTTGYYIPQGSYYGKDETTTQTTSSAGSHTHTASVATGVYQDNAPVQPLGVSVVIWQRTA